MLNIFVLTFSSPCCPALMQTALVKPGTPFHIVLDEQTQRKVRVATLSHNADNLCLQVPHVTAFDDNQRQFGNGATALVRHRRA